MRSAYTENRLKEIRKERKSKDKEKRASRK